MLERELRLAQTRVTWKTEKLAFGRQLSNSVKVA